MNAERISDIEKEVAILKATQEPLLDKIEKNTEANNETQKALVGLTHSINSMTETQKEVFAKFDDHEDRISILEAKDSFNQGRSSLFKWLPAAIGGVVVIGGGSLVWYLVKLYASNGS